jgi:integrase
MPKIKISKRTVDALEPGQAPYVAYDTELTGFGVRVMPSGSKSWIIEYRPGTGGRGVRSVRLSLGPTTLLAPDEARRLARDRLADARRGEDPGEKRSRERDTSTVAAAADAYLKDVAATRSGGTANLYRHYLSSLVLPEIGSCKITSLTRRDVLTLHRAIGEDRKPTANRVLAVLSGLFTFAAKHGLVPDGFNPAKGIDKFREEGRERFLTSGELQRLGTALRQAETVGLPWTVDEEKVTAKHAPKFDHRREKYPLHVTGAIRLLLFTGCRLREILHLRWQDVDFERGLLFLPKSKTGKKTVILNAPALAVLSALPRVGTYVIAGTDPEKPRHDLKKPWGAITKAAGLPGVRIHDLRHSFASVGAGGGMGLPIIGKLLGHSQALTTAKYAHLDADPVRRASERIGNTIATALDGDLATNIVALKPANSR